MIKRDVYKGRIGVNSSSIPGYVIVASECDDYQEQVRVVMSVEQAEDFQKKLQEIIDKVKSK